jgi:hypothetical protein
MSGRVAFLFLGETLLIPHLYPIAEALARRSNVAIALWVGTSVHEKLLNGWIATLGDRRPTIRRAPGFRTVTDDDDGRNPPLPPKLPTLFRLARHLRGTDVVVCAEQTSLWLPAVLPMRARFIDTFHGAGSMMARGHWRRRAGWRTLVAAERDRRALIALGDDPGRIVTTGYVKAGFDHRTPATRWFDDDRPIILYTPHWQRHRSSWWGWGAEVVRRLIETNRYNLIFAPHQRLAERAPEVRAFAASIAGRSDVHCDLDSFAMVDGSYTAAADIYLGDTSSQAVEYFMTPRPCVFLDTGNAAWQNDPSYAMWHCGEVVSDLSDLVATIAGAPDRQALFAAKQVAFAADALGDISGAAPARAAQAIVAALAT